jgi:hypothetical protein
LLKDTSPLNSGFAMTGFSAFGFGGALFALAFGSGVGGGGGGGGSTTGGLHNLR